jgi:hypothetical protein
MLHKLLFIPDDYQAEVAREMIAFFHTFYRFGSTGNNIFDLDNPSYQELLNNIINVSIVIGGMVFFILSIIVVRRCVLNIRSGK